MVTFCNLNNFLIQIQENIFPGGPKYAAYGDSAFREVRRCIFSQHHSRNGIPLTLQQEMENIAMAMARQSIEWGFGLTGSLWEICNFKTPWKIYQERSYAAEQLRVTFLLTNVYTCLNASVVSSNNTFDCSPPRLEEYLV